MKKRKVLGVIPARIASTRLPEKMIADIWGKPMIYYTWRQVKESKLIDDLIIATDSLIVKNKMVAFGAKVVMTSSQCKTGSDRVAEAANHYAEFKPELVLNVQGDEPMISGVLIDKVIKALFLNKEAVMSTAASTKISYNDINNPSLVKVVIDKFENALYFSRCAIPYPRSQKVNYLKHLGIYCFRFDFLNRYTRWSQTPLEKAESLEQLRVLENGYKIAVVTGRYDQVEVDEKKDLDLVRRFLRPRR